MTSQRQSGDGSDDGDQPPPGTGATPDRPAPASTTGTPTNGQRQGEPRLPMALAVLAVGVLSLLIPGDSRITPTIGYAYLAVLTVLLVVLVVGDPGRIDRESPWLRIVTGVLIATITVATAVSVLRIVLGILHNAKYAGPSELLTIGAIDLICNMIAFALWFWHLDAGGPVARAHGHTEPRRAFVFPESELAELQGTGWYPQFIDYLALSFNTSTAFGPTDVSAVKHWAKLLMIIEAAVSLTIVVLVVARAINIL